MYSDYVIKIKGCYKKLIKNNRVNKVEMLYR